MMIEKELQELNAWIAEHVNGWKKKHSDDASGNDLEWWSNGIMEIMPVDDYEPNSCDSQAFQVLKKCAIKRLESYDPNRPDATLVISAPHPDWDNKWIVASDPTHEISASSEDFRHAICLFSNQIFSK